MNVFGCGNCGAALAFDGVRTETCPYCASPNFVEREPTAGRPDPKFVVAFAGDVGEANAHLREFLHRKRWFGDVSRAKVTDIRGVYLPAYLYSAVAHTSYSVTIGEHYTETETYETTDAHGNKKTETRTVTRTEHRPLSGAHVGYVTDVMVSASKGVSHRELGRVEPFDLKQLRRYAPALVSGWIAEEFSRDAAECARASREEAIEDVGMRLRKFMPGDSYSDLAYRTSVTWEAMEPILVPIWVVAMSYREGRPPSRVVINGQTGRTTGHVPLSWWKVTIAILIAAAIIAGVALLVRHFNPPPEIEWVT